MSEFDAEAWHAFDDRYVPPQPIIGLPPAVEEAADDGPDEQTADHRDG